MTKKEVIEGYLYCNPYVGDDWFLSKTPVKIEKHGDLEFPKRNKDNISLPFEKFEKKKIRITIEEIK